VGQIEVFLVNRIVLGMLRTLRAVQLEAQFLTQVLNPAITEPSIFDTDAMFAQPAVLDPGIPAKVGAEAMECLASGFSRYETMVENRLYRALSQLERMQRLRRGERLPLPASGESLASFGNLADEGESTRLLESARKA
jgi:hypothetical protein